MQIVSTGDNLHEMSNLISWENKKNISKCCKILPRVLSKRPGQALIFQAALKATADNIFIFFYFLFQRKMILNKFYFL